MATRKKNRSRVRAAQQREQTCRNYREKKTEFFEPTAAIFFFVPKRSKRLRRRCEKYALARGSSRPKSDRGGITCLVFRFFFLFLFALFTSPRSFPPLDRSNCGPRANINSKNYRTIAPDRIVEKLSCKAYTADEQRETVISRNARFRRY